MTTTTPSPEAPAAQASPFERRAHNAHGRAGSDACMAVLQALWHHGPQRRSHLVARTGLPDQVVEEALRGLSTRQRVYCEGKGHHAYWVNKHGSKKDPQP